MKQFILNSDDFGLCHSVNLGVMKGFTEGILTQASLMAPTPWFEEACTLAKSHEIPVGVHLTATNEWDHYRYRPITSAASLTRSDGTFHCSIEEAQKLADPRALEAEFIAQVELVMAWGLRPQHLDVHMGMVNPEVFARISRRFNLPGILPYWILEQHPELRKVCYPLDSCLWLQGQNQDDWPFFDQPLKRKVELLQNYLQKMTEGIHYNACHLSVDSDEIASMDQNIHNPWTRKIRVTDLELVCRSDIRELLETLNIQRLALAKCRPWRAVSE